MYFIQTSYNIKDAVRFAYSNILSVGKQAAIGKENKKLVNI